jgi:hypothetical protein
VFCVRRAVFRNEKTSFASFGFLRRGIERRKKRAVALGVFCIPFSVFRNPKLFFAGLVAFGEATRPDPIPNSAVKRFSANGTLSQDTGE